MIVESSFKSTTIARVEVQAPTRLHLGLLDLSGVGPRVDGGIGLAIEAPSLHVLAEKSSKPRLNCPPELHECCTRVMDRLTESGLSENAAVNIHSEVRAHVGFGSGTQCALALGSALSILKNGTDPRVQDIARLTGRGGTSGVGVHTFKVVGFIVDGGHRRPEDKQELGSTRAFDTVCMPPLVARMEFPDW